MTGLVTYTGIFLPTADALAGGLHKETSYRDEELSLEVIRRDAPSESFQLEVSDREGDQLTAHVDRLVSCLEHQVVTVDRFEVSVFTLPSGGRKRLKAQEDWGWALGGLGLLTTGVYALPSSVTDIDPDTRMAGAASSAALVAVGGALLGEALFRRSRLGTWEEELGEQVVERSQEVECGERTPAANLSLQMAGNHLSHLDERGDWTLTLTEIDTSRLTQLSQGEPITVHDSVMSIEGTDLITAVQDELCRREQATYEENLRDYERTYTRWATAPLRCADGSGSPTCVCSNPKQGCCSWHGGVAGCTRTKPIRPKPQLACIE